MLPRYAITLLWDSFHSKCFLFDGGGGGGGEGGRDLLQTLFVMDLCFNNSKGREQFFSVNCSFTIKGIRLGNKKRKTMTL